MKKVLTVSFDYRWLIIVALLFGIAGMFVLWRPWEVKIDKNARTVEVVGQAIVTAVPDEVVFSPYYQFQGLTIDMMISAANEKDKTITTELKKRGVPANAIKSSTTGYGATSLAPNMGGEVPSYNLSVVVTVDDMKLAQSVQDYLATTSPEGQVTPQYSFTDRTRTMLESKARDEASKDARKKADQSAKNLGFTIAGVKKVTDNTFANMPYGVQNSVGIAEDKIASSQPLFTLQPGENKLNYSISVEYYIQ